MPRKPAPSKSLFTPAYDRFLIQLKSARQHAGLTQSEVATRLGRPQSFVSKCESGERRVDVVELEGFCMAYEVRLERFIREYMRKGSK